MPVTAPPRRPEPTDPVDRAELEALVEALIEEARQRQRRRTRRRNVLLGLAAVLLVLAFGIDQLVRGGSGVHAATPASAAQVERSSSGLLAVARVWAGESHILVIDPSGRNRPRDLGSGFAPRWSADGKQLVFIDGVGSGGLGRMFVVNADGSGRHALPVPSPGVRRFDDWAPAWSPRGTLVAFTRTIWPPGVGHAQSAIYVFDVIHGVLRRVSALSDNREWPAYATWSPDGRRLAYLGSGFGPYTVGEVSFLCAGLHVINADGSGDHVLAAASRPPGSRDGCTAPWTPAWSPNGRWIAFARSVGRGMDLFLISPTGDRLRRVTHEPSLINVSPSWSADGKRIAFAFGRRDRSGPGPGGPNQVRTLVVIDLDGLNRHVVARFSGHIGSPDWQRR